MFQCVLHKQSIFGYSSDYDIVEDTGLITWDKALQLWEKWKPKVIAQLEDKQSPEMVIWTGCDDPSSYRNDVFHIDHRTEVENGEFVERVTNVIDPTRITMGEPI